MLMEATEPHNLDGRKPQLFIEQCLVVGAFVRPWGLRGVWRAKGPGDAPEKLPVESYR